MERKCFEPSSFFQVTINSTKLISIINQLSATTREHDTIIQQNHSICTQSIAHFVVKLQQLEKKFEQKVKNLEEKAAHEISERNRYDDILNRKIDKNHEQHNNQITTLCQRIYKFNDKLQSETIQARKQVKIKFEQLRQGMQPQLCRLQSQIDKLANQIKNLSQNTTEEIEKLSANVIQDKTLFQSIGLQLMDKQKIKSILEQEKRIQLQKSQKKNDPSQTLKFASFLAKLQNLQKRIQEKQNQNINKVMYPTRSNKCKRKTIFVESKDDLFDGKSRAILQQSIVNQQVEQAQDVDDQAYIVEIHMNISKKLGKIEQLFNDKINSVMKQINSTRNKISVLEQKVGIVSRKSEKYYLTMNQVKDKLKKFEEKKIDEKYYDVLKGQLKRFGKEIQDMLEKKLSISNYEKEKAKFYQKISVIHQNLTEKAEKGEIKNAFLFLQGKIKELILIIAKEQVTQKQGFMTKTALKCLSCDKQVQFQLRSNRILSSKKGKSQNTLRAATGHAKRRVQIMSNIMSPIKASQ